MAVEEALYVVEFGSVAGDEYRNGGVVVLETNRAYGGDHVYYYVGTYEVANGVITASLRIVKHSPGGYSAFGDDAFEYTVVIFGEVDEVGITGQMERVDKPGVILPVRLIMKERLP